MPKKTKKGSRKMKPAGAELEVSDILRSGLPAYLKTHQLTNQQQKVLVAMANCRTHRMGYHVSECDECGHQAWVYNSCKDRHCPKCQWGAQHKWVEQRLAELPGAKYHHTVFTVPDGALYQVMLLNQKVIYTLIYKAAAETLKTFAADPKHLGAAIGMIGVLHTWGQTLNYHVHVHFLVTAGGLSGDRKSWITSKYGDKFLFPVRAMALVFRGKFIGLLKKAYEKGALKLTGKLARIAAPGAFANYVKALARHMFRIHSQPATKKPKHVVKYLGSYMKRVAISQSRLEGLEKGQVVFRYKDNRAAGQLKRCRLEAAEFLRRYLTHILPAGFMRVRYYGIFAGRARKKNLAQARALLGSLEEECAQEERDEPLCERCGEGRMQVIEYIRQPVSVLWVCVVMIARRMQKYADTS